MSSATIFAIAQLVIAVIVVGGGMWAIATSNPQASLIVPLVTLVIGFFFGVSVPKPGETKESP